MGVNPLDAKPRAVVSRVTYASVAHWLQEHEEGRRVAAMLHAAGLPVPKQVWAHGWFLIDAGKMSKSKGNVVQPRPIANVLGMDALRYYMLRETVFGQDGNFSYDALVQRYNSDLANGLGNLASRTLTMIEKYCGGAMPMGSGELAASLAHEINQFLTEDSIFIGDGGDVVTFSGGVVQPKSPGHWMDPGPLGTLGVGTPFAMAARMIRAGNLLCPGMEP